MKKKRAGFLGAALVILGGAGLIFGNQIFASNALAAGTQTEPAIVVPENESAVSKLSNVGMYSNAEGVIYMALKDAGLALKDAGLASEGTDSDTQAEEVQPTTTDDMLSSQYVNPTDGELSEEEAKQIGISAIVEEYGLTQKDIDAFEVKVRGAYAAKWPSTVADKLIWRVQLAPASLDDNPAYMFYVASFDDKLEENIQVHATPLCKEGTPLVNEISSDKAIEIGIAALANKYALTQETLNRFTVTTQYYEITPEAPGRHVWWVNLYPTNTDEFAEIGCYWTYIDAETGDAVQLLSAVDGKG